MVGFGLEKIRKKVVAALGGSLDGIVPLSVSWLS